jgi:TetR/AcrR family transcriptional regulator, regulator of cefoperazone and chloramphenicol sensitivity
MKEPEVKAPSRERLMEAAGEVFAEVGFKAATIREITKRAGVNIAAVNYYFRDKAELYSAVLMHAQRCAVETAWAAESAGPPGARLREFVIGMMRHLLDPLRPAWHSRLMAREMAAPTRMLQTLIDEGFRPKVKLLGDILRDLTGGCLGEKELARAGASLIAQCVFYRQNRPVILSLFPGLLSEGDPIDTLADHITAFSLGGLERLKKASHKKRSRVSS